jgi:hypothetical protein
MFPYDAGNLIRCECRHSVAAHAETGCSLPCRCPKTPSAIVLDEIALLRPEWLRAKPAAQEAG